MYSGGGYIEGLGQLADYAGQGLEGLSNSYNKARLLPADIQLIQQHRTGRATNLAKVGFQGTLLKKTDLKELKPAHPPLSLAISMHLLTCLGQSMAFSSVVASNPTIYLVLVLVP